MPHNDLTYPDMSPDIGASATAQIGPAFNVGTPLECYGVRGIDGNTYVLQRRVRGDRGEWEIVRAGHYGIGAVTSGATPKAAVQHLNAFHVGETCDWCKHVNATRGHACDSCGKIRYWPRYGYGTPSCPDPNATTRMTVGD